MAEAFDIRVADGVLVRAYVQGYGSPVLLVHGACTDSGFFAEAAGILAVRNRVVSYDRRGYGESEAMPGAHFDMVTQTEDAAAVLEELAHGERSIVVAHSAGCCVALELAARHPNLVCALVLHEPALMDCLDADDPVFRKIEDAFALGDAGLFSAAAFELFSLEGATGAGSTGVNPSRMDAYCEQFVSSEAHEVYACKPDYSRVSGMLVFVGIGERSMETYHARCCPELAKRVNGRIVTFPGGHNCACEMPSEFAAIVEGCLSLCGEETNRRES